jgi:CRISPR-associated protein Cmr5
MNALTPKAGSATQRLTLEQQRAQHAWSCVKDGVDKGYVNVAKAMPQLVMNSGLMQTLAYMEQKKGDHQKVAAQLRGWLNRRFRLANDDLTFERLMDSLFSASSEDFRLYTAEALAWLKWLRQFAAATEKKEKNR